MFARIYATLLLTLNLIWLFLKKVVFWRRRGLSQFVNNYQQDRLIPMQSGDRDGLFRFAQCINCGICDTACPDLGKIPREKFPGPSFLVTTLTRATPDFWAIDLDLSACGGCDLCEKVCPNQVPVKAAVKFIEAKRSATFAGVLGGFGTI